jgi:hypothetical protein
VVEDGLEVEVEEEEESGTEVVVPFVTQFPWLYSDSQKRKKERRMEWIEEVFYFFIYFFFVCADTGDNAASGEITTISKNASVAIISNIHSATTCMKNKDVREGEGGEGKRERRRNILGSDGENRAWPVPGLLHPLPPVISCTTFPSKIKLL